MAHVKPSRPPEAVVTVDRMSIPNDPDAALPDDAEVDPIITGSPYGPAEVQPTPVAYGAPVALKRSTGTGWLVGGIIFLVLSLFSFPRGLGGLIGAIATQGNIAEAFGGFIFGAAMVTAGVLFLVKASRVRRANREAVNAEIARLDREANS